MPSSLLHQHLDTAQTRPAMPRSAAPKPSQVTVEVSSDEDDEPVLRGALRGLNPEKNVFKEDVPKSVETSQSNPDGNKHATRASRHGRNSEVNYNMKYHPMDVVTRPNSKAVRERSKSVSFPDEDDDEDESDPTLLGDTEDSEEEDEESSEDEGETRRPRQSFTLTPRTPDPKASRCSARAEARKPVLYNAKFHPQDFGIPGRRQVVIMPTPADDKPISRSSKKRKRSPEVQVLSDGALVVSDEDADVDEEIPARSQQKPRKALKSISNNNQSPRATKKRPANRGEIHATSSPRNAEAEGNEQDDLSDIPPWLKNQFAHVHKDEVLTHKAAVKMLFDGFHAHQSAPLIIRKPYLTSRVKSKGLTITIPEAPSTTLTGDQEQDMSTTTLAGDDVTEGFPSATPSEEQQRDLSNNMLAGDGLPEERSSSKHDDEPDHHPSQFEEEMAITETPEDQSPCPDPGSMADLLTRAVGDDSDAPSTDVQSTQEGGGGASSEL